MECKTNRLCLQALTMNDADDIFEYAQSPNVGPYAGWKPHASIEETHEVMKLVFINQKEMFGIVLLTNGKIIGTIGFMQDSKRKNSATRMMGYVLGENYWGNGYMTEAARTLINWGFKELQLQLISAYVYPFNKRSKNVLKRLKFHYEGTLARCETIYTGDVYDNDCYALYK